MGKWAVKWGWFYFYCTSLEEANKFRESLLAESFTLGFGDVEITWMSS